MSLNENEYVTLSPGPVRDVDVDPVLERLLRAQHDLVSSVGVGGGIDSAAPFDLRVKCPTAIDLLKLWQLWGNSVPPMLEAKLGPRTPVLLEHVVTPFPKDGHLPGRVFSLGYEFVLHDVDADTMGVIPSDDVLKIGTIGQKVELGLDLGAAVSIPDSPLGKSHEAASFSLPNAKLRAVSGFDFQFGVAFPLTLRKIIGAPVGKGGAKWSLYRQNEPLDRPHSLLQTLVVSNPGVVRCTIKTWATKAGYFGTRIGAKYWPYEDQEFTIDLRGLIR